MKIMSRRNNEMDADLMSLFKEPFFVLQRNAIDRAKRPVVFSKCPDKKKVPDHAGTFTSCFNSTYR